MPKRTTAQKRAREMQAQTGRLYHECLNEARAAEAAREVARQPDLVQQECERRVAEAFPAPSSAGLFSHRSTS